MTTTLRAGTIRNRMHRAEDGLRPRPSIVPYLSRRGGYSVLTIRLQRQPSEPLNNFIRGIDPHLASAGRAVSGPG